MAKAVYCETAILGTVSYFCTAFMNMPVRQYEWVYVTMCYIYCWLQMARLCTIITMIEKCRGVWVRVTMVTVF